MIKLATFFTIISLLMLMGCNSVATNNKGESTSSIDSINHAVDSMNCGCLDTNNYSKLKVIDFMIKKFERDKSKKKSNNSAEKSLDSLKELKSVSIYIDSTNQVLNNKRLDLMKSMDDNSNIFLSWCILIIGGSIVIITNDSYRQENKKIRYLYFSFIPGWSLLALSIYKSIKIIENYEGAKVLSSRACLTIYQMQDSTSKIYMSMQSCFEVALCCFAFWI